MKYPVLEGTNHWLILSEFHYYPNKNRVLESISDLVRPLCRSLSFRASDLNDSSQVSEFNSVS